MTARRALISEAPPGMRFVEGGAFTMGSNRFYSEERPARRVRVGAFWVDEAPVTNAQFAEFVLATGYRTLAEQLPDPKLYAGLTAEAARAGSLVFEKASGPVHLDDHSQWWSYVPGADWQHPTGPGSGLDGLAEHPVVHVAYTDAEAYADWSGKALPTEAEWEFAARGGLEDADYAWGDELAPGGVMQANYWQGLFPFANQRADGGYRTTPVRRYPPNGYGLFDMIGNVWEWTRDWYSLAKPAKSGKAKDSCCAIPDPRGGTLRGSMSSDQSSRIGRKVIKGGSHLCAANYCRRYRPAARSPQPIDSSTGHIGFRCILRAPA